MSMDKTALSYLKSLVAIPTPSGSEHAGQRIVAAYMRRWGATVETDIHGNVHGVLNGGAAFRVMLAGHCDEIGLMVQFIDERGYIYVSALGGINVPLLSGERVLIHTARGSVPGVIGVKPIHLMTDKERENSTNKIHELWIDIGARNRKEALKVVSLGDVATIATGWIELRHGLVACRGFDNRIGSFVISDVLRLLARRKLKVAVHAVSTVQEEVGLRGARTAAFRVDPHVGVAVDVGFATDYPGMDEKIVGTAKLGHGPILHPGPTYNPKLLALLHKAAAAAGVKTQVQPEPRGMGTDAYAMQMTRGGVASGLVSIPNRYMHSPVETLCLDDVEGATEIIAELIARLTGKENLA
jgi:tetrahedral aminopeptidase